MTHGIDVSHHNAVINWQKVKKAGVDFAILRAGYGKLISQKDKKFEEYYAGAKQAGIPVGCYWYSYAKSVSEIQTEAKVFLEVIKGKQFEYPVYLDFEEKSQFALGKAKCSAIAEAFLNVLESAGYFAGIYASKSHLESYLSEQVRSRYAVWVAHYGVKQTSYSGQSGMWQYSDSGVIPGIPDNHADLDICYLDYPGIIRNAGKNGFCKPEEIQKETIKITAEKDGKIFSGTLTEQ